MWEKVVNEIILLKKLVANDLKSRYAGSAFGLIWAYIQPLVTILVFWYVFQLGFRNPPVDNVEYILWFISGYIPWIYFNDAVMSSSNVMYEYSFLVKKMKFSIWQLPIIKILASLCIHAFFIVFIIGMFFLYGYDFRAAWISIFYYSACLTVLLVGFAYFVAAFSVFLKDASQIVAIILQIGFWLTPIFWSKDAMNDKVLRVLKLNPLFYIVEGYREALTEGIGFWNQPIKLTLYFWCVSAVLMFIGISVFKKLEFHFADLL